MILVKLDRWLVSQVAGQPAGARQQNTARRLAALRWVPAIFFRACCGHPRSDFLLVVFSIAENHTNLTCLLVLAALQQRSQPPLLRPPPTRALFKRARTNLQHSYRKHQNVQSQSKLSLSSRNRVCCCQWAEECCASGAGSQCCAGQEPRGRLRVADSRETAGDAVSDPRIWRLVLPGWRLRCL